MTYVYYNVIKKQFFVINTYNYYTHTHLYTTAIASTHLHVDLSVDLASAC